VTRLAFLQLSDARFGGILPVLLSSCSRVTYIANTLWVIKGSRADDERRRPKESTATSLLVWTNH
jgi:hypothetical protein